MRRMTSTHSSSDAGSSYTEKFTSAVQMILHYWPLHFAKSLAVASFPHIGFRLASSFI